MCQMASFIVTKKRVYWSETTDSHEDIIQEHKLKEKDVRGNYLFVRVEISPPDKDYKLPLSKWEFKLDQDVKPDWYDAENVERRTRIALKAWYKACIIPANKTIPTLSSHIKLLLGTVQEVRNGGTVQKVGSGGTVQEVRSGGTVQKVGSGGTVQEVRNGGTVQKVGNGGLVQEVYGSGLVQEVFDGGTVEAVYGGGTVITHTKNLTPKILKNASAVLIDRSGKTVVCYTGENK